MNHIKKKKVTLRAKKCHTYLLDDNIKNILFNGLSF